MSRKYEGERLIELRPIERYVPKEPIDEEAFERNVESAESRLKAAEDQLGELHRKKIELQEQTEAEIAEARSGWESERASYVEAARQEGFEVGLKEGRQEGRSEYDDLIERVNTILGAAQKDYEVTIEKSDHAIIELAIATAQKIMNSKLEEEPDKFAVIVSAAIQEIKDRGTITINLNPTNYEAVLNQKEELERLLTHDAQLQIYLNEEITENGCVIEHAYGQIDASIDTQLKEIRDILHELALERRQ
ncbi:flagellar assembly protein FliH [Aciduricibacillus chroicocephali]|uniref:Flagellar assembly protein FliH n=1 Tax=Aciduricibacillus chroicocephali TaxID=3054939 RepID=A0ABY9KYQ0_9BACI|nr:flagellar assembly protein FliH [Bacillaceae bacterium 44XB]